jgi:nucleoside-diphosphate-sugar epimerase
MSLTIAVLGASGVYGRQLVPRLVARGHAVRALVRRPTAATSALACGAEVRAADVFDAASLRASLTDCDVAINLATSLPSPAKAGGDYAENDRLRREGTPIWIRACAEAGVPRVIQQSIAMVNGAGDAWADEDTVFVPAANPVAGDAVAAALAMEDVVRASGLEWLVLRGGLFHGPGTGFDEDWFARGRAGKLRLPGDGADWVSLVHIADMAAATVLAIERWPAGRALIVADDRPVQWRELLSYVAVSVGGPPPAPGGRPGLPSFRVRNQRACDALGWRPFYTDYRVGLAR